MRINEIQLQPTELRIKNNQDKQVEKFKELSSRISTYEDRLEKTRNNKTQIYPLALQVKNEQN